MNKTIVVLANSKKTGGRCLAGKELIRKSDSWEIGNWIRPVTSQSSGAVPDYQMSLALGRGLGQSPRLLEVIEIPFARPVPMPDQPENWLLDMPMKPNTWRSLGFFAWADLNQLLDKPAQLWSERTHARRVTGDYVEKMEKSASLYLIKPDRIESVKIWSESNPQYGTKGRRRVSIRYAGMLHELDIDDVDFQKKYYPKLPTTNEPAVYPQLKNPQETVLCVSLTPKFEKDGNHYKIAAAFLEPSE